MLVSHSRKKKIDEYFKKMKIFIIRDVNEEKGIIVSHFLQRLNPNIKNVVELRHSLETKELVHLAAKVEQ